MAKILLITFLSIALSGCFTSKPQNNAEFENILKVKQLEGVYKNAGVVGKGEPPVYLSELIWPSGKELNFKAVEKIEVRAINETTITVRAHGNQTVLREETFTEGKDFEIERGVIRLKPKIGFAGVRRGEPLVGPYYEGAEIGIDQQGHGKYQSNAAIAGLLFMMFPVAFGVNQEVRFEKISP